MRQVAKTKQVMAMLEKVLGTKDFDPNQYAVFETIAINTLPLSKKGIYNKGVMSPEILQAMANFVNKETVPLHTMHRQAGELPVGRVFEAKLNKRAGRGGKQITELHSLFYISLGTQQGRDLVDALDSVVINEVSVGVVPKKVSCSKCGFDYIKEGDILNWLDRRCANDHKVGENGVHVILDGLEHFLELSLVSIGAADHARILDESQRIIANDDENPYHKLAAAGGIPSMSVLVATKGTEPTMSHLNATEKTAIRKDFETRGKRAVAAKFAGITDLLAKLDGDITADDAAELRSQFDAALTQFDKDHPETDEGSGDVKLSLDAFVDLKAELKVSNAKVTEQQDQITQLSTDLAAANTQVTDLTAKVAKFDALQAEHDGALEFLKVWCQQLLVATGIAKPEIPNSAADLISTIKVAQGKLSKLPAGGLALPAESGASEKPAGGRNLSVFAAPK